MRLKELVGKKVINLNNGRELGQIKEADIILEASSGKIESIILHNCREKEFVVIPCYSIKQIGSRVIIVDLE